MKICSKCKKEKEFFDFHLNKRNRDGYASECKPCCSEQLKQYYLKNKEKLKVNTANYQKCNPEKTSKYNKNKRNKNPLKYKIMLSNWLKKESDNLSDHYIKILIVHQCPGLSYKDVQCKDLIESKRLQIKLERIIKDFKNGKQYNSERINADTIVSD